MPSQYLSSGLYTVRDAAVLVNLPLDRVRRWVDGYRWTNRKGESRGSEPIFCRDYQRVSGKVVLSFLDLVELWFVGRFLETGLSIHQIRSGALQSARFVQATHPFCTLKFGTDGKRIFVKDDAGIADLATLQQALQGVLDRYIRFFDFDTEFVTKWWPRGKDDHVVIDPRRCFGKPILDGFAIPVHTIYEQWAAKHSIEEIAWWYEVPKDQVAVAVDFEREMRGRYEVLH